MQILSGQEGANGWMQEKEIICVDESALAIENDDDLDI